MRNTKRQTSISSFFNQTPKQTPSKPSPKLNRRAQPQPSRFTGSFISSALSSNGFEDDPETNSRDTIKREREENRDGECEKRKRNENVIEISEDEERVIEIGNNDVIEIKQIDSRAMMDRFQRKHSAGSKVKSHKKESNTLSEEQQMVVDLVLSSGLSVFFTGSAGTGKSVVLRELVGKLRQKYRENVGITASTGMAACNISGQTIHKFLGIGIGTGSPKEIAARIKRNNFLKRRWESLAVLVIDEISMIDGLLFHKLNAVARILRKSTRPFGGIQVVCCGDFFQLPPVSNGERIKFCFETDAWKETISKTIVLTQVFRQKGDTQLIDMLNALRYGEITPEITREFRKLDRRVQYSDGIEPTELYPTRAEVKAANEQRLRQLPYRKRVFHAVDNASNDFAKKLLENFRCEEVLELKEGAQVMHLVNTSESLVNGSVGTVVCFLPPDVWSAVLEYYSASDLSSDSAVIKELRLLARRVGNSANWTDEETALYSAIPPDRIARFERLCTVAMRADPEKSVPIVNFGNGNVVSVERHDFQMDIANASSSNSQIDSNQLVRSQFPLILAWAMSIHKAQGQTIDRLRIDLKRIFEMGQTYVALSRATNKEHLEVLNFIPERVRASPVVKEYYKTIDHRMRRSSDA